MRQHFAPTRLFPPADHALIDLLEAEIQLNAVFRQCLARTAKITEQAVALPDRAGKIGYWKQSGILCRFGRRRIGGLTCSQQPCSQKKGARRRNGVFMGG